MEVFKGISGRFHGRVSRMAQSKEGRASLRLEVRSVTSCCMRSKLLLQAAIVVSLLLHFLEGASVNSANPSMSKGEGAVHIVHMEKSDEHANDLEDYHLTTLASVCGSKEAAKEVMGYSYSQGMCGFSAKLTDDQVKALSEKPGVLQVVPSRMMNVHDSKGVGGSGPRVTTIGGAQMSSLGGAANLH